MGIRTWALGALLGASLAACATTTAHTAGAGDAPRAVRMGNGRDPITEADIARINATSAYDAIVRLRGNFLRAHGVNSVVHVARSARPIVFVDGVEYGSVWELRSIPAGDVREIRYLSSSDAMLRYGDGYLAGVIQVVTKQ